MKTRTRVKRLLRALVVVVATLAAIEALYAVFLIHSVHSITLAVRQLRSGVSSEADVKAFAKRFRLFASDDNGCRDNYCTYDFAIANRPLSIPKISPPAVFIVALLTQDGVLTQVDVGIFRAESRWWLKGDRVVRVFEGPYSVPGKPTYKVTGPDYDPVLAIWLQKGAPSADRDRAYAFKSNCIALPFGCGRPCDYHTEAWKDAKEFTVQPNSFASDRRGTFRLSACR